MAVLQENFTNSDGNDYCTSTTWLAQTFTPANAHSIIQIDLLLFRVSNPGTATVSIRATDGSGLPTGADLTSGTLDVSAITTDTNGLWYSFSVTSYALTASVKYAIVLRPSNAPPNYLRWRDMSGGYTGGNWCYSANSGSSWSQDANYDFTFKEYSPDLTTSNFFQLF